MSEDAAPYDYRRFAVLFVDDEEKARKYFRRLFGDTFRVLEASDGNEASEVFRSRPGEIGVIVADQRLPDETGSAFLARLGENAENVVKILSVAYSDLDSAIDAVNRGGVHRYLTKPWDIPELELALKRAMEFFIVRHERDALLHAKVRALSGMLSAARIASFALVPAAAGLECRRSAEAVADFVRFGAVRASDAAAPVPPGGEWRARHDRQLEFVSKLGEELETALDASESASGLSAVRPLLDALAPWKPAWDESSGVLEVSSDPFPGFLGVLLGRDDAGDPQTAAKVLAGMMAFYRAGGRLTRKRNKNGFFFQTAIVSDDPPSSPDDETARWLFDDEQLLSAALGLL
jgi:CheY-like chemotaxis protein